MHCCQKRECDGFIVCNDDVGTENCCIVTAAIFSTNVISAYIESLAFSLLIAMHHPHMNQLTVNYSPAPLQQQPQIPNLIFIPISTHSNAIEIWSNASSDPISAFSNQYPGKTIWTQTLPLWLLSNNYYSIKSGHLQCFINKLELLMSTLAVACWRCCLV